MKTAKEFLDEKCHLATPETMEAYAQYVLENQPKKPSKKKRRKLAEKKLRSIAKKLNRREGWKYIKCEHYSYIYYSNSCRKWEKGAVEWLIYPGRVKICPELELQEIIQKMGSQMDDLLL